MKLATSDDFARLDTAFRRVVAVPLEQRAAALDESCGGDIELRREVERLLSIDQSLPGFVRDDRIDAALGHRAATLLSHGAPVAMPARIGQYEIKGLLGSGGMGAVYRAQQAHPRREVALKVMRHGAMSKQMIRRFEFEADVLARLQHPSIAQVFEAGTWDDGGGMRPFFAMEFVDGRPLTTFAVETRLPTEGKLRLLVDVCRAVEHAHQKGVIHRDLKPDNVLVTAEGAAKVLDFGIARATASDVQVTTMSTSAGDLLGTLPYMSPEQVAGNAADVDTRCDVYALGVMMFQLLAETLPHDLEGKSIPEAARMIADDDARRLRSVDPRFDGDLDTIASKAMSREREIRYASAGALADDIERFLRDEPIAARPATRVEQWRRFARRNKALAASIAVAFASLAAATAFSAWMAWREHEASMQAQVNSAHALKQADRAERVKDLMIGMFAPVYPSRPDNKVTVESMLAQASDRVRTELQGQPDIADEMYFVLGTIYQNLDLPQHAAPLLEELLARQKALGDGPETYLATLSQLGHVYNRDRDHVRSVACRREILQTCRAVGETTSIRAIRAMLELGHVLPFVGEFDEAVALCREAQALLDQVPEDRPNQRFAANLELGAALWMQGRSAEAETLFRHILADKRFAQNFWPQWYLVQVLVDRGETDEALVMLERLVPKMRTRRDVEPRRLGMMLTLYAEALDALGEYAQAEAAAREAIGVFGALDNANTASALKRLASAQQQQGRNEDAMETIQQAFDALRQARRETWDEAQLHGLKARVLADMGLFDDARAAAAVALSMMREAVPADHPKMARPLLALATVESLAGRPGLAADLLRDALHIRSGMHEAGDRRRTDAEDQMAVALIAAERLEEARRHLEAIIASRTAALGADDPRTLKAVEVLSRIDVGVSAPPKSAAIAPVNFRALKGHGQ